jgi:hypothetical protein
VLAVTLALGCAGSLRAPARTDDPGIARLIARDAGALQVDYQLTIDASAGEPSRC